MDRTASIHSPCSGGAPHKLRTEGSLKETTAVTQSWRKPKGRQPSLSIRSRLEVHARQLPNPANGMRFQCELIPPKGWMSRRSGIFGGHRASAMQ